MKLDTAYFNPQGFAKTSMSHHCYQRINQRMKVFKSANVRDFMKRSLQKNNIVKIQKAKNDCIKIFTANNLTIVAQPIKERATLVLLTCYKTDKTKEVDFID